MRDVSLPLQAEALLAILPHRPPFLLIDRVIELDDQHVVALKNVTVNEPFFVGHFPGHPVMPGVLIVEAMAQAGAVMALSAEEVANVSAHAPQPVHPERSAAKSKGDTVEVGPSTGSGRAERERLLANKVLYFVSLDRVKFRRKVVPGDQLRLEVEPLRQGSAVWKMKGRALVDGAVVAEAEFVATVSDRPAP